MTADPLFILGTERSGSNLLRLICNAHSRITIPHPPHILRYFRPLEAGYGDLSTEANWAALVRDIVRLVRTHIYPWEIAIDEARLRREAQPRDAFGVYVALHEQHREQSGKARWGCKSTFMVDEVAALRARFAQPKMILLVRDPRDVAVSSMKSIFSTFHPVKTAALWAAQTAEGLRQLDLAPADQMTLLRYEDLVADPQRQLRALFSFLGEPFEAGVLRFFEGAEAKKSAGLSQSWKNTGRPISQGSVGRFAETLSPFERIGVEAACAPLMERLGYPLTCTEAEREAWTLGPRQRLAVALRDGLLEAEVELESLRKDRNVGRRYRRALLLRALSLRRGAGRGGNR
jgi:hypothetical protein